MMRFKTRYRFWHVFLAILAIGMLYTIFWFIGNSGGAEEEAAKEMPAQEPMPGRNVKDLLGFLYMVVFFYFTLNYYYNLLADNKKVLSFLKTTAVIIGVAFVYHTFLFYYLPGALQKKYASLSEMFFSMMGNMIPMFIVSFLFSYATISREALKQRRILEAQKLQLEAQISQANFNFLKAQINPHFLHNTLNFLYAKSLPYSPELSEGILTLSDIMRYALGQGNQKDGKAPLEDEIEHVRNVIRISQLRYSNQLNVQFEVKGTVEGATIIPFVLITLVENAFKHGDLKNQEYPIEIKLNVEGDKLYFFCRNRKKPGPKQLTTGIGLENIKKRLELAYGADHTFTITDAPECYTAELTIDKL